MREAEKKAKMDAHVAQTKIKELKAEVKNLQGTLRQIASNLALTLEKEKEMERKTEERIQDAKHSFVKKFKASPAFAEEMARAIEVFKVSEEYHDSHVAFNKKRAGLTAESR